MNVYEIKFNNTISDSTYKIIITSYSKCDVNLLSPIEIGSLKSLGFNIISDRKCAYYINIDFQNKAIWLYDAVKQIKRLEIDRKLDELL